MRVVNASPLIVLSEPCIGTVGDKRPDHASSPLQVSPEMDSAAGGCRYSCSYLRIGIRRAEPRPDFC